MPRRRSLIAASFALLLAAALSHAFTAKKEPLEIAPKAQEVMRRFGESAAALTSFTVTVDSRLDVRGEPPAAVALKHLISVSRPGNLRVETLSQEDPGLVIADGAKLTLYLPALKKYQERAPLPRPEQTLAAAGLGGIFLTALFDTDPAASYLDGVTVCAYIGQDQVDGQTSDHLRFIKPPDEQGRAFSWEVWFRHDAPVLPLRMVPDFPAQPADAEFLYTAWQLNPALPDHLFRFTPPDGVEKSDMAF